MLGLRCSSIHLPKVRFNLALFYHKQKGKTIGKPPLINKIVKSDISRPDPQQTPLADFKAELQKNSFPLDKAREAQKEYEQAKAARKRQLLSAAAKHL